MKKANENQVLRTLSTLEGYHGAKYLTELILHPNQPIHATQLRNLFNQCPEPQHTVIPAQAGIQPVFTDLPFSVDPKWELPVAKADRIAIEQVKQRLLKVIDLIASARECNDLSRLDDLYDERDKLMDWLKQAVNKFGRPRYLMSNTQKDYQTVRKSIFKIIAKLEEMSPRQAELVRRHLKTGHRFEWVEKNDKKKSFLFLDK